MLKKLLMVEMLARTAFHGFFATKSNSEKRFPMYSKGPQLEAKWPYLAISK